MFHSGIAPGVLPAARYFPNNNNMDVVINVVNMGMGRRGESGDCLAFCMQMTCFCVVCVEED